MRRLLFLTLLGALGAALIRAFCFEGIYIATNSMAPTFETGTHLFVNKFTLLRRKPKRGEIVMFTTPQKPDKGFVKRVVAIEGDVIALRHKRVYINNVLVEEPYVHYSRPDTRLVGDNMAPILIPEGFVFVMGDNRDESLDSRDWKSSDGSWSPYVPLDQVKGTIKDPK